MLLRSRAGTVIRKQQRPGSIAVEIKRRLCGSDLGLLRGYVAGAKNKIASWSDVVPAVLRAALRTPISSRDPPSPTPPEPEAASHHLGTGQGESRLDAHELHPRNTVFRNRPPLARGRSMPTTLDPAPPPPHDSHGGPLRAPPPSSQPLYRNRRVGIRRGHRRGNLALGSSLAPGIRHRLAPACAGSGRQIRHRILRPGHTRFEVLARSFSSDADVGRRVAQCFSRGGRRTGGVVVVALGWWWWRWLWWRRWWDHSVVTGLRRPIHTTLTSVSPYLVSVAPIVFRPN